MNEITSINKTDSHQQKAIKRKKKELSRKTINIIRTAQRNNIELTAIADNKANVLLSLNAIMLTVLVPAEFAYFEVILSEKLLIPIVLLAVTCFTTMYLSAQVLKPANFKSFRNGMRGKSDFSPFFYGNFYKVELEEFYDYMDTSLSDAQLTKEYLAQDLYYIGKRLGAKLDLIRKAFNIFILGIFLTMLTTVLLLSFG